MSDHYKWVGTADALYMDGRWTERADLWKCDKCLGEFWSIPPMQKCLRREQECPKCDVVYVNDLPWYHRKRIEHEVSKWWFNVKRFISRRRLWG